MISPARPVQHKAAPAHGRQAAHTADALDATHTGDANISEDLASTIADEVARRAEVLIMTQRKEADAGELALDHMRTSFDMHEQERAELMREWNVMRDMAMEQMKRDNEIMKKWITLI